MKQTRAERRVEANRVKWRIVRLDKKIDRSILGFTSPEGRRFKVGNIACGCLTRNMSILQCHAGLVAARRTAACRILHFTAILPDTSDTVIVLGRCLSSLVVASIEDKLWREILGRPAHGERFGVHLRLAVDDKSEGYFLRETEVNQPRIPFPVHHDILGLFRGDVNGKMMLSVFRETAEEAVCGEALAFSDCHCAPSIYLKYRKTK